MAADSRSRARNVALIVGALALLVGAWLLRPADHGDGSAPPGETPPESPPAPRTAANSPRPRAVAPADGADGEKPATDATAAPHADPPDFRVVVVAKDGGAPIAGAEVGTFAGRLDGKVLRLDATTGADGRAAFAVGGAAACFVSVRKARFQTVRAHASVPSADLRVELAAGVTLSGRVVDADTGAAVAGVRVQAWRPNEIGAEGLDVARTTDDAGHFEFAGLPPGEAVRVFAAKSGFGFADATVTPTDPSLPLEIVLGRGGVVEGTVYDTGGAPLAGVETFLLPPTGAFALPPPDQLDLDGTGASLRVVAYPAVRTDSAGRFTFRGALLPLDGNPRSRVVVARDAAGRIARSEPVDFTRHGERAVRDVRFPAPSKVSVRVASGSPPPEGFEVEIAVVAEGDAEGPDERRTDIQKGGAASAFDGLPPGRYVVRATAGDISSNGTTVMLVIPIEGGSQRDLAVDFTGEGRIDGTVVGGTGKPVAGVRLRFSSDLSEDLGVAGYATSDAAGRFAFTRLPAHAGEVVIEDVGPAAAEAGDIAVNVRVDDVMPGGPPLVISLAAPARVTGRFVPRPVQERAPVLGVAAEDTWARSEVEEMGENGTFRGRVDVVGRPVVLYVRIEAFAPAILDERTFAPGSQVDLGDVALDAGLTFEALLRDAEGHPLANAALRLADPWLDRPASTDAAGRVRLERLPRRPVHLHVDETGATAGARITFDPAARTGTFTLGPGVRVRGRLVGVSDKPVGPLLVSLVPAAAGPYESAGIVPVTTGADGRFAARLLPGRWRALPAYGPPIEPSAFDVADGENPTIELRIR